MKRHQNIIHNHFYRNEIIKILITLLLSSFFIACKKNGSEESIKTDSIFTITHKANDNEPVFVYLKGQKKLEINNNILLLNSQPYRLPPYLCIHVIDSQFDDLIIQVGTTGLFDNTKTLCGDSAENKCKPNHYEIANIGNWIDEYVMTAVEHPNPITECVSINEYMELWEELWEEATAKLKNK